MSTRRTVKKITPHTIERFDTQFWPVIVALVVLSGITAGAILTLLKGPWLWGSLMGLPILVAVTIFVLQRVDNRQLRRALQFAIIISMAAHILILVMASVVDIFGKDRKTMVKQAVEKPQRVILVSQREQPKRFEEITKHEIPEPEIEVEKETTTTQTETQPTPTKQNTPTSDKQFSKSAERSQSVPRFDESLSELKSSTNSRRTNNARTMPKTSEKVANNSKPSEQSAKAEANPGEASMSTQRQTESQAASAAPTPTTEAKTSAPKTARSAERRQAESTTMRSDQPSRSTARIRRNSPSMPKSSAKSTVAQRTPTTPTKQTTAPKEVMDPVTRREQTSLADRRSVQDMPKSQSSRSQEVTQSLTRRSDRTPAPPSISEPTANPVNPRRSRRNANQTVSTEPIESPSTSTSVTQSGESRMQPTAASMSPQKSVAVGSQVSKNVGDTTGSMPSTATKASDTASRRRTTSRTSPNSLTSAQQSNLRRSVANNRQVESALKATTQAPAKLQGSQNPSSQTATASAATVDSASQAHRGEVSAQRGEARIDIGPTKVVTENSAQRRSGGGQPETGDVQLEAVARTRQSSGSRRLTLDASPGAETVARNEPNSRPASSTNEAPAESQLASDRQAGSESMAGEPVQSSRQGPASDQSNADIQGMLAENRDRRGPQGAPLSDSMDDEDEEEARGNARTRLSQSPKTDSIAQFSADEGQSDGTAGSLTGALATKAIDVAVNGRGTANLAPAAGKILLQAANSLPMIQSGSSSRRAESRSGSSEVQSDMEARSERRSNRRGNLGLSSNAVEMAAGGSNAQGPNRDGTQNAASESVVEVARSGTSGSIELQVDAMEGPAGLSTVPTTRVGVRARPASKDSDEIQPSVESRFKRKDSGGKPALNPDAVVANKNFTGRNPLQGGGGGPQTEKAIELGLEFLKRNQKTDGRWTLGDFDKSHSFHKNQLTSDTAATGLAIIAFQGAGYNHREFKYAQTLDHAIEWLVAHQDDTGCLYISADATSNNSCRMYSHAIATLALTEAYGMTLDKELKEPIEKAIRYIENTQDENRGGWRYFADVQNRSTDTSVTGWMLMALQSARLSDFEIEPVVFERIERWLDTAKDVNSESLFKYNPYGVDTEEFSRERGRQVSPTMTSVGLLMRLYMGWDRSDVRFQRGADFLLKSLPANDTIEQRDTYYWYYATQVMRHAGGVHWEKWNEKLHPMLLGSQEQYGELAGSWHPYLPVPDRWGHAGGRLYVTTMNLLSLEVNYRLLPLYDETSK